MSTNEEAVSSEHNTLHYYSSAEGLNLRELVKPGDVILYYPKQLSRSLLPTHIYQNYLGYGYFDNLCTHAAIALGGGKIIDAMPELGVGVRSFESDEHIFRIRRIVGFDDLQMSRFIAAAHELKGASYNTLGILGGATGLTNTLKTILGLADRAKAMLTRTSR